MIQSLPTPKKSRTQGPKTTVIDPIVKVVINNEDNMCGGGFPDEEVVDYPETFAACLSPFKHGAQVTNSVSTSWLYLHIVNIIALKGLVQVKTEDTLQATHVLQQGPSQISLQASQCQCCATGHLKAWSLENLPNGCNVNNTSSLLCPQPTFRCLAIIRSHLTSQTTTTFWACRPSLIMSTRALQDYTYDQDWVQLPHFWSGMFLLYLYLACITQSTLTAHPLVPFLCE